MPTALTTTQPLPPLPSPHAGMGVTPEQQIELLEYWRSITKRKWAIITICLAAAVLSGLLVFAITPVYRSTATLLIEAGKVKVLSIEDVYTNSQQREHFQTQVEILKSREVAERTVEALKLWNDPAYDPRAQRPGWRATLMAAFGGEGPKTDWSDAELAEAATRTLMKTITVEPVRLSQLVKISVESDDSKRASKLANAVAEQYIESDRDARFRMSQQVSSFLEERLAGLRANLLKSEQALQTYREQKGIVNIGGSAQAVAGRQVGDTAERLVQARARRLELESAYEQAKVTPTSGYAAIPSVLRDPGVAEGARLLNAARRNLAMLQQTLGDQHSRVQQAMGEVADLQKQLTTQSQAVVTSLRREYEAARGTETSLERSLGSAKGGVQTVNREEFQLGVLEREAQSNRQLYDMFTSRAKETSLSGDVQQAVARLVDRAVPISIPVRPEKLKIVAIVAVLTLLLASAASLLLDRIDNTVKGGDDAEVRLRQPVLASLPLIPNADRSRMARMFIAEGHSHYSEGIRTARTGVLLSSLDIPNKILLITSTLPGEGKTTVAVNLALAHAQTKRTLLIDADMRRSQAARALGLGATRKGLTNLVAGNVELKDCLYEIGESRLSVMPVGDMPPNPLELLLSQRFKDVLTELSEEFEIVVIDSPPVELVSEALVLAPMATSIAYVVKAMSTPTPLIRKNLMRLQRAGGNILGVVVNQLDFKRAQRYYGEYGSKDYGYGGYVYGSDTAAHLENDDKKGKRLARA